MSVELLLNIIRVHVPELYDQLSKSKVIYEEHEGKTYIIFVCSKVVGVKEYKKLEKAIQEYHPSHNNIVFRIAYPDLREAFLEDPEQYRDLMLEYLGWYYSPTFFYGGNSQKQFILERPNLSNGNNVNDGKLEVLIPEHAFYNVDLTVLKGRLTDFIYYAFIVKVQVEFGVLVDERMVMPEPMYEEGQFNPYGTIDAGDGYVDDDGIFYEY